jgi:hypothetical protein
VDAAIDTGAARVTFVRAEPSPDASIQGDAPRSPLRLLPTGVQAALAMPATVARGAPSIPQIFSARPGSSVNSRAPSVLQRAETAPGCDKNVGASSVVPRRTPSAAPRRRRFPSG